MVGNSSRKTSPLRHQQRQLSLAECKYSGLSPSTTESRPTVFLDLETCQFPNESAELRPVALNITPNIPNLYGAILIFRGFFWSDPHPTPVFCRNMAKICELHIPHKFKFSEPMIRSGYDMPIACRMGTDARKGFRSGGTGCGQCSVSSFKWAGSKGLASGTEVRADSRRLLQSKGRWRGASRTGNHKTRRSEAGRGLSHRPPDGERRLAFQFKPFQTRFNRFKPL